MKPRIVVLTGPSGAGKSTCEERLLKEFPAVFGRMVSMTTRPPREGEVDGIHYHFKTRDEFNAAIESGELIEHAEFCGTLYGTPFSSADATLREGKHVLLTAEIQGARSFKASAQYGERALVIFISPRSFSELKRRIELRGKDDAGSVAARLERAQEEMEFAHAFDYTVINADGETERTMKEILFILFTEDIIARLP